MRRFDRWLLTLPLPVQRVLIAPLAFVLALANGAVEGGRAFVEGLQEIYAYLNERRYREERAASDFAAWQDEEEPDAEH